MQVLDALPEQLDDNLLISGGPDDAGVYRIDERQLMIQSVDFFTPIVDDPADYGKIAAANSLSDVYAMGATPATALNIVGVPLDDVGIERLQSILDGEADKAKDAGTVILGGHTTKNPEPLVGLAVTGFVNQDDFVQNRKGTVDDRLILTKPLGTGILTTAYQRDEISESDLDEAVNWMKRLNDVGITLARQNLINCMTDITGYGLGGHLQEMLTETQGADLSASRLPVMDGVDELATRGVIPGGSRENWEAIKSTVHIEADDENARWFIADAQTSGGLLLAVNNENVSAVQDILRENELRHECVGQITETGQVRVRS